MRIIEPYKLRGYRSRRAAASKKLRWSLASLSFFLLIAGYITYCLNRQLPVIAPNVTAQGLTPETVNIAWPNYGQAAIGAAGYGLLAYTPTIKPVPIASTAKVMTALAILSKHPIKANEQGPTITLNNQDVQIYKDYLSKDGSVLAVNAGDHISEYQALEAMLVASANNIADTMAIWAFGSMADYLNYANQFAKELNMSQSHFSDDASGFSPATVSTAQDLVRLGLAAMRNSVIAQIVNEQVTSLAGMGNVQNTNTLLGKNGIIGLKTGHTDQAGACLLLAANHAVANNQQVTVISAILSGPNLATVFKDNLDLLNSSYLGFASKTVVNKDKAVAIYRPAWGLPVEVKPRTNISAVVWRGNSLVPSIKLDKLRPPVANGQMIGTISIQSGGQLETANLLAVGSIKEPGIWWRLTHPF